MFHSLFSRLIAQTVFIIAALVLTTGLALDRFLVEHETGNLKQSLIDHATILHGALPLERDRLNILVSERGALTGIRFTVIEHDGKVIADSLADPATMDNHADRPEVVAAAGGERGYSMRYSDTLGHKMLYVAIPTSPVIRASMPLSNVEALLSDIRARILWVVFPTSLLALTLAYTLSVALTKRFKQMKKFAGALAGGDFTSRLNPGGKDELSDLERSLVAMGREFKSQKETLEAERMRLRILVDGLRDGVVVFDGEDKVNAANRMALDYLKLGDDEIKGMLVREAVRAPKILTALQNNSFTPPGEPGERMSWPDPDREIEFLIHRVPDLTGKSGKMLVIRDVTHRVHLERVRSDFISNMAHELRTPLTAIRGAAETLTDSAIDDPEASPRFLSTISRHAIRLENILSDVSDLSRIESGGAPVKNASFDARKPVKDTVRLFAAEAQQRELELIQEVPAEPLRFSSDIEKIESILINLVQNALRYTTKGSGKITVKVTAEEDGNISYSVRDNGIGIAKEAIERVTERFYRVDPGRSREQGGTGLGLAIVNHLVVSLGGELLIESAPGKGTSVSVKLTPL